MHSTKQDKNPFSENGLPRSAHPGDAKKSDANPMHRELVCSAVYTSTVAPGTIRPGRLTVYVLHILTVLRKSVGNCRCSGTPFFFVCLNFELDAFCKFARSRLKAVCSTGLTSFFNALLPYLFRRNASPQRKRQPDQYVSHQHGLDPVIWIEKNFRSKPHTTIFHGENNEPNSLSESSALHCQIQALRCQVQESRSQGLERMPDARCAWWPSGRRDTPDVGSWRQVTISPA